MLLLEPADAEILLITKVPELDLETEEVLYDMETILDV